MTDASTEALAQFLDALFDPTDTVEIRFLPPTKKNQWWLLPGEIPMEWDEIAKRNEKQDVYFGANPREGRGGTAASVAECRCVFADFDDTAVPDATAKIAAAGLPEPTVVVNSGHGVHTYWRLEEPIKPEEFTLVQMQLVAALGSDPKVKDPPRIMRLPFTRHVKKKSGKVCEVVVNRHTVHDLENIVMRLPLPPEREAGERLEPMPEGAMAELPAWANRFLVSGTGQGDRNATAFNVACAMKGAGWPQAEAERRIGAAGASCVPPMDPEEVAAAVRSAYGKERTPAAASVESLPIATAWQQREWLEPQATATAPRPVNGEEGGVLQVGERIKPVVGGRLGFLSNVIESNDKEGKPILFLKPIASIVAELKDAGGGWPRRAGGRVFVPGDQPEPGELPAATSVRTIAKPDELFAWLHTRAETYWVDRQCVDPTDGGGRTPVKRNELFEHVRETIAPAYEATEVLPHEPPAERTWYAPCVLPRGDRSILQRFVERLNWDTAIDRDLMLAALLTPFWGGPKGQRPAFVFQSRYGAGSGKTTTATLIADISGGYIGMGHGEDAEQFTRRLLSDSGLARRCVLIDNVKGKMDVAGVEALITAPEISGHRLYFGHATRPNRLTWMLTANHPQLSHDLAERSVPINVGAQKADAAFIVEMHDFITANRSRLVAAALDTLAGEDRCTIEPHNRDRWARWQAAILQKLETGNEIAAEVIRRRSDMDADQDDAAEIAAVARALIRHEGHDPDTVKAFMSRRALADAVVQWQGEADSMGRRKTISYITNRLGAGHLSPLRSTKYSGERGFAWIGPACIDADRFAVVVDQKPETFRNDQVRDELGTNEDEA